MAINQETPASLYTSPSQQSHPVNLQQPFLQAQEHISATNHQDQQQERWDELSPDQKDVLCIVAEPSLLGIGSLLSERASTGDAGLFRHPNDEGSETREMKNSGDEEGTRFPGHIVSDLLGSVGDFLFSDDVQGDEVNGAPPLTRSLR